MYDFIKIELRTTLFSGKSNMLMFGQNIINWERGYLGVFCFCFCFQKKEIRKRAVASKK